MAGTMNSEQVILAQMGGIMQGLQAMMPPGGPKPLQQGRVINGAMPDGADVCGCAINPTHCFRTVSQRSLNVPTRFLSEDLSIAAGDDLFDTLFTSINGALGDITPGSGSGVVFNSANGAQAERARVYDLVLIAVRSDITVLLDDATAVGAGAIDVSAVQSRLEELANEFIALKVFHASDPADPWIDHTNLRYFQRPPGQFVLVPPVKFIDRDPYMEIVCDVAEKGGAAGGAPVFTFPARDLQGCACVTVEAIFIPDPSQCSDLWPGELCPRDTIANTATYKGTISSAIKKIVG